MTDASLDFRLPDLRFVPTADLVPHEQHDDQRLLPLLERLREQAVLKNPPIVTPLDPLRQGARPERFVVLDGANRVTAARAAGFPHMLVQVVPYEEPWVRLSTWYHGLGDYTRHDFEATVRRIPGLEFHTTAPFQARALLARREALACVVFADGSADTLHALGDLAHRNQLLNEVVDTYRHRKRFFRLTTDSLDEARVRYPEVAAIVLFPHFEACEVVELATGGARLPAGITRHLIRWRALRLNMPIERLLDPKTPLPEKNRWLKDWMHDKLLERTVRYYEEPTVLFDE